MIFNNVLNAILSPILVWHPAVSILLIGGVISSVLSIINKKTMGTKEAKEMKKKMEKIRADLLEAQKAGDKDAVEKISADMMAINTEYLSKNMKLMMKPMLISLLLALSVLPWMQETFSGITIVSIPEIFPLVGGRELSWLWWYAICTLTVSITMKKVLGE